MTRELKTMRSGGADPSIDPDARSRPNRKPAEADKDTRISRKDKAKAGKGASAGERPAPRPVKVRRAHWHIQERQSRFEISIKGITGRRIKRMATLEDVEDPVAFRRLMTNAGLSFNGDRKAAITLHGEMLARVRDAAADREKEGRLTSELGWHDDGKVFVLPGATLPAEANLRFEPGPKRRYAGAGTAGSFKAWRRRVAEPAVCSSRIMVAIGAALAALLLLWTGRAAGGFGITVAGVTRTGKTITIRIAKSVLDEPTPDAWGVTRAGATADLLGHTDLPVFLDETAAPRGGKGIISELTNILSGGRPDVLAPAWVAQHDPGRPAGVIRSVLLATTEGRLHARRRGERARLTELPAARPGSFGVIDYPERANPPVTTSKEAGELLEGIDKAAACNHGHAYPRMVAGMIRDGAERLPGLIDQYGAKFDAAVGGAGEDGWARSVHANFRLIHAALRLAHRYEVVLWHPSQILDAVTRCLQDALRAEAAQDGRAEEVAGRIREWILEPGRAVARIGPDFDPGRAEEYEVIFHEDHGHEDHGVPVALVPRERLLEPAGGEAALDAALAHMKAREWLIPNRGTGAVTRQKRLPGTDTKLRFVFVRAKWLEDMPGAAG